MRGSDRQQGEMFSYGSLEQRVAEDHPLRRIHVLVEAALAELAGRFEDLYSDTGRPSIAPERLLRAMLLQVLYSIRSDRALMEHIDLHRGFRWFAGLNANEEVWDASTFSKNRERLLGGDIAPEFFDVVLSQARSRHWLSDERFTVDGTLIEAWASKSSYKPKADPPQKGGGSGRDGTLLKRDLFVWRTDPEAYLFRKSGSSHFCLSYPGHVLSDVRHGLIAATAVTPSTTQAEREAAVQMVRDLGRRRKRICVAADKGYDESGFVQQMRALGATPQVTQYTGRRSSAIDRRTTRHESCRVAQRQRRNIERIFGWLKQFGGQRRTRFGGRERVEWMFAFAAAAFNLLRMANLSLQSPDRTD
jgi:transposase